MSTESHRLIDTHVHFDDQRFDADRDRVYQRAVDSSVKAMVVPAVTRDRWDTIQSLAEKYTAVYATAGLHPVFCDQHQLADLDQLELAVQQRWPVAIGECGLDGFIQEPSLEKQKTFFDAQLLIARQYQLPVIIHARNAVEEVILTLKHHALNNANGNGVVHSYNGSLQQAHRILDLGYKVSFGGPVTYPRSRKLHSLIRQLPIDAMMLETDAPDQPPHQTPDDLQNSSTAGNNTTPEKIRNEPACIANVLQSVATLRDQPAAVIAQASNRNACQLFSLPKTLAVS